MRVGATASCAPWLGLPPRGSQLLTPLLPPSPPHFPNRETKGYVLKALKMKVATRQEMEAHYADLSAKGFFAGLVTYMT